MTCLKEGNISIYKGIKCQECELDYFKEKFTKQCFKCSSPSFNAVLVVFFFVLGMIYYFTIIKLNISI